MSFENLKIEIKDVIKLVTLALMLQGYYFATTGKIETMLIDYGYQKKIVENNSQSIKVIEDKLAGFDIKFARIFTILYKDADKPKQTKIETEE